MQQYYITTNTFLMKQYFLFVLFLCLFLSAKAQNVNWKQIDVPSSASFTIFYQSKSGWLFANNLFSRENYLSKDQGNSWQKIGMKDLSASTIFREDKLQNIYIADNDSILLFNPISKQFQKYLVLPIRVLDFDFYDQGNLAVCTYDQLLLFSSNKTLLKSHDWWTHSARILINTVGDTSYVTNSLGASFSILRFTNDLSYIGPKISTQFATDDALISLGRLFLGNRYSDDGKNWKLIDINNIETKAYDNIIKDFTNHLFINVQDSIYASYDNGKTFGTLKFEKGLKVFAYNKSKELIGVKEKCNGNEYFYSSDEGANWAAIKLPEKYQYATNFSAGTDEVLYLYNCDYGLYKKKSKWDTIKIQPNKIALSNFVSLKNNSTIGFSYGNGLAITEDKGLTWTSDFLNTISPGEIVEKGGVIFAHNDFVFYYSEDFGKTWNGGTYDLFLFDTRFVAFSKGKKMYYLDPVSSNDFKVLDLIDSTTYQIPFSDPTTIVCLETSFNEEKLYVLTREWQPNGSDQYFIQKTVDGGKTFSKSPIPNFKPAEYYIVRLTSDHLGNLYLNDPDFVLISKDDGLTWNDITPANSNLLLINSLRVSHDNYIYVSTLGAGILKYEKQLAKPKNLMVHTFDDANKNCIQDAGETAISNLKVIVDNNYTIVTDKKGLANFYLQPQSYEVTFDYNTDLYDLCKTNYTVNLGQNGDTLLLNVPVQIKKYCADMKIALSNSILRRCFSNNFIGNISNEGNISATQNHIVVNFDPSLMFESASLTVLDQNDTMVVLDAGLLEPGDTKFFHLQMKVSCSAVLGQTHCISAGLSASDKYCDKFTQLFKECKANVGSYDPNDKAIFVNGNGGQTNFEKTDRLEYQIRFQNTGTDTAFHVRIEDPIIAAFDIQSIRPIVASHPFRWRIADRKLIVDFDNIQLVDSFKNEALSHGFIKFAIELDSTVKDGDFVQNQALIYFDFNDPIITNNVVNEVGGTVSSKDLVTFSLALSPNPTDHWVYILNKDIWDPNVQIKVFDSVGKSLFTGDIPENRALDLSAYPSGLYVVSIKSRDKNYVGKVMKW